jgi:hypothetical protein
MDAAKSVSATFSRASYALAVTKEGSGTGTVTSAPAGIDCGADCTETYEHGTVVTLTANASAGSRFAGWSGACSGADTTCTVTMNAARAVTARFNAVHTLTVTKEGSGSGTVTSSPAGINCGTDCAESFDAGALVTLTATPNAGSTFGGWGGACSGMSATCTVTMDAAKSVTATFTGPVAPPNSPPNCSGVKATPKRLWPPNHKMRLVTLSGATDPDGDPVTLTITGVTQDEPIRRQGRGDRAPDAKRVAGHPNRVKLRAERKGTGNGRVYRIAFTVSDGREGTCTGVARVQVRLSRYRPAVDSGRSFNSFGS